eukprot:TRINITY_DN22111_c0_g1_i3.p1 TRINITY_DN22111_c0_g1~~TRINITY_DN22111_c0_g1_i3.p1  ORF type:complete len:561 (+),score=108.28 TRINITY_DN22111_c0_g1_i3:47-1729(+)
MCGSAKRSKMSRSLHTCSSTCQPPGDVVSTVSQLQKAMDSGEVFVLHIYADQRHFFGGWMHELARDVTLLHVNVFTVEEGVLHRLRVRRFPLFMVYSGRSGFEQYMPGGWDFMDLAGAVRSVVLQAVPYGERVQRLYSEADLDNFMRLHPAGSAQPRVIVFMDDVRRPSLAAWKAAGILQGTHHFATIGSHHWAVERFKLRRVPSVLVIDPATRQGSTTSPVVGLEQSAALVDHIRSANFVPELDARSFADRCDSRWEGPCRWVALFLVPSDALGSDEAARKALRRFREACKLARRHAGDDGSPECFWLRHGSPAGAAWREALRPSLAAVSGASSGASAAGASEDAADGDAAAAAAGASRDAPSADGVWVAAFAGSDMEATAFPRTVLDRELAQRDLMQWMQQLSRAPPRPVARLAELPPLPEAEPRIAGPRGFAGRLLEGISGSLQRWTEVIEENSGALFQLLVFAIVIGWPFMQNFLAPAGTTTGGSRRSARPATTFANGQRVVVTGLKSHTEYNGLQGTVVCSTDAFNGQPVKCRVQLRVNGEDKTLSVRQENLRAC